MNRWYVRLALVLAVLIAAPAALAQTPSALASAPFSCNVENVSATTQCAAVPPTGLRVYITGLILSNEVATAQSLQLIAGTGTNCATTPVNLSHKIALTAAVGTTTALLVNPIVATPGFAVCVSPTAATAFGATLTGFVAP